MIRSFTVKNFRGLRELTIGPLERVNLIAGKNNVGKTALLEALWLHSGPNQPRLGMSVNAFRGLEGLDPREVLHELFWSFDPNIEIELIASGDWGPGHRVLQIRLKELDITQLPLGTPGGVEPQANEQAALGSRLSREQIIMDYKDETGSSLKSEGWVGERQVGALLTEQTLFSRQASIGKLPVSIILPARHKSSPQVDSERFGKLEVVSKHEQVVEVMKRIEPRLKKLTVIPRTSTPPVPMLHAELEGYARLLPLPLLGDGMARLSSLALAIASARDGLVLVDEIENGLHHTVMKKVWSGIAQFAREFNVQLFATTHSLECIRAAHDAFSADELYDFRLHRLDRVKDTDTIRAVTYERETLDAAIEIDSEVR
jgi:hypothetical protein